MLTGIIDWFKDIFEQIKERIQNPFAENSSTSFAGAFLVAFTAIHWKLVYSILYFDDGENRAERLEIIKTFLVEENLWTLFFGPALIAIASLSIYYITNNLTLVTTIFFNKYLKVVVLRYMDRSQTRTKEEFDRLWRRANRAQTNYEKANQELLDVSNDRDEMRKQLSELNVTYTEQNERLVAAQNSIGALESELGVVKGKTIDQTLEVGMTFRVVQGHLRIR